VTDGDAVCIAVFSSSWIFVALAAVVTGRGSPSLANATEGKRWRVIVLEA
jgi:hypothetical protein